MGVSQDGKERAVKKSVIGAAAVSLGLLAAPTIIRRLDHMRSGDGAREVRCTGGKEVMEGVTSQDGTALHVEYCGNAGPTVFFAHGWTCCHTIFRHQMSHLCARYRVVAMDQRGHGKSAIPASKDFSIDRLAEDLKAVVDASGPEEFVIVGHAAAASPPRPAPTIRASYFSVMERNLPAGTMSRFRY
jgi:hypothetical protein